MKYTHGQVSRPCKHTFILYIPLLNQSPSHTHNSTCCSTNNHRPARSCKALTRKRIPPTQNTNSLTHTLCWPNKQTKTHTYTPTHKNQPSGSTFHFISRAGKEQAGESIHAVSSCAEGGFAAMETDEALLQIAALIQSTGVNTHTRGWRMSAVVALVGKCDRKAAV